MRRLPATLHLRFPFRIEAAGTAVSARRDHVREQIEQVLFTTGGERVFRPEFGAGAQRLVFEPNAPPLWELTRKRLTAALVEALRGEVDPRTLEVEVSGRLDSSDAVDERLQISIRYQLAALGEREEQVFDLSIGGGSGG